MPSITITDLNNAKIDVDHIADIANSVLQTATDRLGHTKLTIQGAVDTIAAFNSRAAWAASTAYAVKDLVLTGGVWYVCVLAHTSSAAFATDSAKWRVHQGVTSAQLSASTGASLIGYGGSNVQSVLDGLRPGEVNIGDPRFAGGADKNGVTDATAAIQAALDADLPIYMPAGRYKVNGTLLTSKNTLRIRGDGDATVLDFSGGGVLNVFSTVTSLPFISASMIAGSNQVSFAAAHGLVEGDVFALHNPTDFSFAPFRNYYRDGCMFRVAAVPSANTVITFGLAPDTYAFGAMNAYKINGGSVVVKDLKIIPPPTGIAMWIDAHQSVKLHDVTVPSGSNDTAIEVYRCFDVDVRGVKSDALLGDAYPIVFANTQKVTLSDSALYSVRHCIAIGGRDGPASVPPRDIRVNNCILENDGSLGIGSSDIHGNAVDIVYNNCKMNSNANMAGKDVAYIDCQIGGRPVAYYPDGNCIIGSEVVGGVFEIIGCKLTTQGNGSANSFISLNVDKIRSDFMLVMRGNTIISTAAAPTDSKCVTLFVGDSSPPAYRIDVVIDGLTYKASAGLGVLGIAGANDISAKSSFIVDNFNGPSGINLMVASNAANYNAPMRLQRQSGRVTLSAASGQGEAISANIPFRYPYPRPPSGQVSAVSDSGGALLPVGGMYALTATAIRPKISSTYTAWPSTNDVVACWTAGIAEI